MVLAIGSAGGGDDPESESFGSVRGLRVLVVDDDEDTLELLDAVLSAEGVLVACASSVAQAFELLVSHHPQVIISDIEMPTENGHSFLRNLRSVLDEDGGTTPAIALTGRAEPEERAKGLASGFNLYLTKPTTPAALLGALDELARGLGTALPSKVPEK